MNVRKDLLYTEEHEWVAVENGIATVGITDYAQGELGDIVFIELPDVDDETTQMDPFGTIEAVKAVSDLFAPLSGKIVEVNLRLADTPELINQNPYGEGWMVKIKLSDISELDSLLSPEEYTDKIS
ncbi:glycine cleavage system protein GcvH [candidate division KSB1 bacterium]|nr:glycine cleavage system protein GcvH [candidate division KSB1 bacterium]